jgi:hypothetical protein
MQPVQLAFTYREAEYVAASRLLLLSEKMTLVRVALSYCLMLLGLAALLTAAGIGLPTLFWAILIPLYVAAASRQLLTEMPRRYFRGDRKLHGEYALTFSDEGVWLRTNEIESRMAWSLYSGVREGRDLYVIAYGRDTRMMTVVPKRAFRGAAREAEFRRLLRRHVEQTLPQRPVGGEVSGAPEYVPSSLEPPDWR